MEATTYGAIVLAGGGARRMGGVRKPEVRVGGVPMIERVLAAVTSAGASLVVGPSDLILPPGVAVIQEAPPGGGPAAAVAAAFAASPGRTLAPVVAIVAGDLPLLTAEAVRALLDAARLDGVDGAVYVDTAGRPQWLCGAWRTAALRARIAALAAERPIAALAVERPADARRARRTGMDSERGDRSAEAAGSGKAGPVTEAAGSETAEPPNGSLAGAALRDLFGALAFTRLPAPASNGIEAVAGGRGAAAAPGHHSARARADDLPPWFDCDTEDDIRRAEEWLIR